MRKRVRRRKNKVLRKVLILGLCLWISGWLMSCIDKKANVVDDQEVVESDIGQVEVAEGIWVTADEYEQIARERDAWKESEAASAEAERDLYLKSLETTTIPEYLRKDDDYMLAKIAMAEAEGEDTIGKALVIRTVLNRVKSDDFPDTVKEVIFQENQFTPIKNGRYDRVTPNEDCYKALELVKDGWNESDGALYFERTTSKNTWHSKNLTKLFTHGNHTFYSEKGGK
ncbi:cell wall hydrolase [Lachnoanaerobaculum orale]|uniref:cell wall hydrolase n=1 Tax=Lachnoanaerobaculum orale TaxID=979627 RepID=UPI0023A7EAC8|nr:cell wall hydrolase [Lachnoanaerobaculum orale]